MVPPFYQRIGTDRYLSTAPLAQADPHPLLPAAWDVYWRHFGGFTGSTLDPLFHRLSHPARQCGSVRLDPATSVVVAGTGPSLRAGIARLQAIRQRVRIFTSPRGAEALLPHGIVPDLVLVEHQTALDAHHSQRHARDSGTDALAACPLVAADWGTPAAMLRGVREDALFVPSPLPTWGLWTATAVAMAIDAGARRVALLGVDLGTADAVDPVHQPLVALLALLARLAPVVALDCGDGAHKPGWVRASIGEAGGADVSGRCELSSHRAPRVGERAEECREALRRQESMLARARAALALATEVRAGRASGAEDALRETVADIMAWREDEGVRIFAQEHLGLAFLPRLWRIGVDTGPGVRLWRPVMLATHELVRQAEALDAAIRMARAA